MALALHPHSDRVFSIPGLLAPAECASVIAQVEAQGFEAASVRTPAGPQMMAGVRNNERAMLDLPEWRRTLWERLAQAGLPVLEGAMAAGLPRDLRFYKYSAGQRFKMHKDGPWTEGGLSSRLTLLVYLNDSFAGGATDFRSFAVQPATGAALLFVHDTWHEGAAVTAGIKYVLRSDVMYAPPAARLAAAPR